MNSQAATYNRKLYYLNFNAGYECRREVVVSRWRWYLCRLMFWKFKKPMKDFKVLRERNNEW